LASPLSTSACFFSSAEETFSPVFKDASWLSLLFREPAFAPELACKDAWVLVFPSVAAWPLSTADFACPEAFFSTDALTLLTFFFSVIT
jgi:hypothetical protein